MASLRRFEEPRRGTLPGPVDRGRGRTAVRLVLLPQGRDLVLLISGGAAHVGAVAAADDGSAQAVALGTHREGPLAQSAAAQVARAAGCSCAAVAGIHQDDATPGEIAEIKANVEAGVAELVAALSGKGEE